jgi:flagella basal body P-ring formation protein FlgA
MRVLVLLLLLANPALADSLVAARTLRAHSVLAPDDMVLVAADLPGALTSPDLAVGQETRVAIYAGRPILATALGPAALVERNQTVLLIYRSAGLTISTEGRALDRGAEGARIKVMNLASKSTVTGVIGPGGVVHVGSGF